MHRYFVAIALAVICLMALAEEPLPKELSQDQEIAAIRSAEATGLLIYIHDRAAAVATDALRNLQPSKMDERVRGWITEQVNGDIFVTFIDQTPAALYRVFVSSDGVAGPVTALEPPSQLTAFEAGAAAARKVAVTTKYQRCAEKYNSVVLPAADASASYWVVYLLPGTTKTGLVPIGGTHRLETKGAEVVSQRAFTRSCIALQTVPDATALMITHLLDPIPTEAHVFWSLWAKKPIYVSTPPNGTVWVVEGNKIRLLERKAAKN